MFMQIYCSTPAIGLHALICSPSHFPLPSQQFCIKNRVHHNIIEAYTPVVKYEYESIFKQDESLNVCDLMTCFMGVLLNSPWFCIVPWYGGLSLIKKKKKKLSS